MNFLYFKACYVLCMSCCSWKLHLFLWDKKSSKATPVYYIYTVRWRPEFISGLAKMSFIYALSHSRLVCCVKLGSRLSPLWQGKAIEIYEEVSNILWNAQILLFRNHHGKRAWSSLGPACAQSMWQRWTRIWEATNLRHCQSLEAGLSFCLGSVETLNQNEMWPQDWLSSMLISWNRHTLCGFCED